MQDILGQYHRQDVTRKLGAIGVLFALILLIAVPGLFQQKQSGAPVSLFEPYRMSQR